MYSINKSKVYDYDIYSYFCDNEDEARERRKRLAFLKQSAANIHILNKSKVALPSTTAKTTISVSSSSYSSSNNSEYCSSCNGDNEEEEEEEEDVSYINEEEEEDDDEDEDDDDDNDPLIQLNNNNNNNNTSSYGCYTNANITKTSSSSSSTLSSASTTKNKSVIIVDSNNNTNHVNNNNSSNNKICSKKKNKNNKKGSPVYISNGTVSSSSYDDEDCLFEDYQDGTIQLDGDVDLHRQRLQQDLHQKLNQSNNNNNNNNNNINHHTNGNGGNNGGGSSNSNGILSQNSSHNGIDIQSQLNRYTSHDFKRKDWNDEFQTLLALPATEQKYSKLSHLARDFVAAAKNYATIIINELCLPYKEKSLQPVDVGGIAGGMKWYCQGILFKFAMDTLLSDDCWMYGGDAPRDDYASKAASNELKGLISYYMTGVQGLHYPLIALIDYKGFRIIALSLLPINSDTIRYGSCDSGTIVHYDVPDLNSKMREAGKKINLKPHKVGSDPEFTKVLSSPGDIEAHLGTDNRYYVIDFSRTFPPEALLKRDDVNRRSIFYNLLRPEFVAKWGKPLCSDAFTGWQRLDEDKQEHNKEIEEATEYLLNVVVKELAQKLDGDLKGRMLPNAAASGHNSNNNHHPGEDPTDFNEIKTQFANKFLPIVMKRLELGTPPPQVLQQQAVAGEINNTQLSSTMNDSMDSVATSSSMPDTPVRKHIRSLNQVKNETPKMLSTLVEEIHRFGINLRHMGRIRHFSLSIKVRDLLLLEMTARSIKTIIKDEMRTKMKEVQGLSEEPFKQIVILIFNQVLDYQSLIWKRIRERIKSKYSLAFIKVDPRDSSKTVEEQEDNWMDSINPRNLFERLQLLTGISLSPIAQHEFTRDPFSFQFVDSDIQEIYANVKHMNIVDYAEGMALSMAAKSKSGREQLRLLKMATSKFQSSLKSNPDNFDCICQMGRTLILQANSINVVSGAFGKNLYLKTLEEAAAKFKDAIQIEPTNYKAYYELAHLYILIANYYHNVSYQAQKYYKMAAGEFDSAIKYYDPVQIQQYLKMANVDTESATRYAQYYPNQQFTRRILVSSEGEGDDEKAERELFLQEDLFTTVFSDAKKLFDFGKEGMSMPLLGVAYICEVLEKHRPKDVGVKLLLGKALVYRPSHHEELNERQQQEYFVQAYTKFNHALVIDRDSVYDAIFKIGKDMWINSKLGSKRLYYPTALIFRLLVQYHPSPDNKIYSMYSDSLNEMIKFTNDDTFVIELSNLYDKLFKMNNQYILDKLQDSLDSQGQSLVDLLTMATYSKEIKDRLKLSMFEMKSIDFHRTSISDQVMGILGEFFDHQNGTSALESVNLCFCPKLTDHGLTQFLSVVGKHLIKLDLSGLLITQTTISVISNFCPQIQSLDIQNCPMIAVESLTSFSQLKNLRRLDISKCKINSEVIFALASLPHLVELNLRWENRLSDETFTKGVFPWHHLQSLDLTSCSKLSDVSFLSLPPSCPNFQTLILESCYNLTDATINSISTKMTRLTKLSLKGCKFITDTSLVPLTQRLTELQDLKLSRCHSITSISLEAIATNLCNTLEKIDLSQCPQLEEFSIQNLLLQCTKLTSINLSENPNITQKTLTIINTFNHLLHLKLDSCSNLIDDGTLSFSNLEQLQTLSIQKLQISHQSFLNMTTVLSKLTYISLKQCLHLNEQSFTGLNLLTHLEYLDLSNNSRVLDGTMISICAHLKNLKYLDLTLCIRLTTKSFLQIGKHLQSLETLIMNGCANLNDSNVIHLAENLCHLRHLDLSGAGLLTDRSVHFLADHLIYLEKLFLRECNNITQAAIDYIKSKCTLFRLTRLSLHSLPLVGELRNASPSEILKPIKVNEGTTSEWRQHAKEKAIKQKEMDVLLQLQREQEKRALLLQQQKEEMEGVLKKKKKEDADEQQKKTVPEVVEVRYRDFSETLDYKTLLQRPIMDPPLDPSSLEKYLTDESFIQVFKITKSKFQSLPKWKGDNLKKDLSLF